MEVVKDRVALISYATDEVGAAIGQRLAEKGAKVIISDTDQGKVDSVVSAIKAKGGDAVGVCVDGTNSNGVKALVAKVFSDFGKVDILVNNADVQTPCNIQDITDEQWQNSFNANLSPVFYFCREILPKMQAQQYGRIINVGNLEYIGWPGKSDYSAVKSAIFGFTRSLALESAKDNVTVNCVAKGDIQTADMSAEEVEKLGAGMPVKKLGTPEDVARAICFFASDTSKYLTGQTFFVCGGKSAYFSMSI